MSDEIPTSVTVIDGEGNTLAETEDPKIVALVRILALLEPETPRARRRILSYVQDKLKEDAGE